MTLPAKDTGNVKGDVAGCGEPVHRSIEETMTCPRPATLHSFFHSPVKSLLDDIPNSV